MDLMRINDVVNTFGLSSRTLRYYEQAGILWSAHPDSKAQRYYDEAALERLRQIVVLRKLQIPVKDIAAIFRDNSTSALIRAFMDKLESLGREITALSELRRLVDDFLQKLMSAGITKISAITLLYEETEKRLTTVSESEPVTLQRLSDVSRGALRLHDVRLIRLPAMRFLTSRLKTGQIVWQDGMESLFADYGFVSSPGLRDCFFRKEPNDEWTKLIKIPAEYENTTEYADEAFAGGLFAVSSSFMEDMDETFIMLKDWVNKSEHYELDIGAEGQLRCSEMLEEIMPWDIVHKFGRYQQDVFVPIRIKKS